MPASPRDKPGAIAFLRGGDALIEQEEQDARQAMA